MVEKRGKKWCMVHCHGTKKGRVIKCYGSKKKAMSAHRGYWASKKRRGR